MSEARSENETGRSSRSLNLTPGGVTLIGVLLSIGVTVGFSVGGGSWLRLAAGLATTVVLIVVVKLTTSAGRGPLARLANWVIGHPDRS
jgi:hypothetical protein